MASDIERVDGGDRTGFEASDAALQWRGQAEAGQALELAESPVTSGFVIDGPVVESLELQPGSQSDTSEIRKDLTIPIVDAS